MIQVGELPTCKEIVESVTDYLEGQLSETDCVCYEQHLVLCDGCDEYVHQMRFVVKTTSELAPTEAVADGTVDELLALFRARRDDP